MYMIPPNIDPETTSDGEKDVFTRLGADKKHPDWIVLHSLDIPLHLRQMEGEADFVIFAPGLGVVVVEVKGCRKLRISRGKWYYGNDRQGSHRSPFKQAKDNMHSIRDRVKRHGDLADVPFFHAVIFSFIPFEEEGEWADWQVVDVDSLESRPLGQTIHSLFVDARRHTAKHNKSWFHPDSGAPTREQCEQIVDMLRPDYEVPEPAKARSKRIDAEIDRFTKEQFEALNHMRLTDRVVFDGPAGTGKTLLALEAARRGRAAMQSVLFLCFNRPLYVWLQEQVQLLPHAPGAPVIHVDTIHNYMKTLAGEAPTKTPADGGAYFDVALPKAAAAKLRENRLRLQAAQEAGSADVHTGPGLGIYDQLVMDEAQDILRKPYLTVLDRCVKGGLRKGTWRSVGDFPWQTIYGDTVDVDEFREKRGGRATHFPLDENCRNSLQVAEFACAAGAVFPGYSCVLRGEDTVDPILRFYADQDEQCELLERALADLYDAGYTGPQIAVLSVRGDDECVTSCLKDSTWLRRLEPLLPDPSRWPGVNLRSGNIRYSSIHRFKGLDARAVVLTDIEKLDTRYDRSLVYVGATRATHHLVVLAHESLQGQLH